MSNENEAGSILGHKPLDQWLLDAFNRTSTHDAISLGALLSEDITGLTAGSMIRSFITVAREMLQAGEHRGILERTEDGWWKLRKPRP